MNTALCRDDNELMVRVIAVVAGLWGVPPESLGRKSKNEREEEARRVAMYLGCAATSLAAPEIGHAMGGVDRLVVICARESVRRRMEDDPFFLERVRNLKEVLASFRRVITTC